MCTILTASLTSSSPIGAAARRAARRAAQRIPRIGPGFHHRDDRGRPLDERLAAKSGSAGQENALNRADRTDAPLAEAPLVVEFVGLSGAGKSTVAEALLADLRGRGLNCLDRQAVGGQERPKALHYGSLAGFFLRRPGRLWRALRFGLSRGRGRGVGEALRFYVWVYRLTHRGVRPHQVLLLDQGVVQEGWGLMVRQQGWTPDRVGAAVADVMADIGARYILVYFEVDVALAARRVASRPTAESRFDLLSQPEAEQLLQRYEPELRRLYQMVVADLGLSDRRVDASQPADLTATRLSELVRSRIGIGAGEPAVAGR